MIQDILQEYLPDREIMAFGSRVTGTAKPYSDLDLVVMGENEIYLETMAQLKNAFAESDLPYRVDIVEWCQTSEEFKHIIIPQLHPLENG